MKGYNQPSQGPRRWWSRLAVAPALALALSLVVLQIASAAGVPDFAQYGFPRVVASADLQPGQAATVDGGQVKAVIPANAFTHPVKFELLEGDNSTFQSAAPSGQTVIANFAFRVTDQTTGSRLGKFNAPVVAVITDPRINGQSQYLDTTATNPIRIEKNPFPAKISGDVLKHGNIGDPVGWVVTSPAVAGLPNTGGVPLSVPLAGGAALVLGALGSMALKRRTGA